MAADANGRIIVNNWQMSEPSVRQSCIVDASESCEGIDLYRYEAAANTQIELSGDAGHIFSLLRGAAALSLGGHTEKLTLREGTHVYVPPKNSACIQFIESTSAIHASGAGNRNHGTNLLIHGERYLAPARFILTPQYLSRRAFLNRDHTLVSRSGDRIAWFHTTMFDTRGLPPNHDGLPVFKMSYDHQTEINVVYEVSGEAAVRFADHPYIDPPSQRWGDWYSLDNETTYYLNECADGDAVELYVDPTTSKNVCLRNRHEIFIAPKGHVSLCCLFDPGPTGLETHQPGAYSSYAPVSDTLGTRAYREFLESVAATDRLIHRLSYEQAANNGEPLRSSRAWPKYEALLTKALQAEEEYIANALPERRPIMEPWRIKHRCDS